jgi:hypothetical protein
MRINKEEALALAKVLHTQQGYNPEEKSDFEVTLADLAERIDSYLVHGDEDDCCDDVCEEEDPEDEEDEEEEEDEEAEDDSDEEEDPAEEGDEEDDEDEGEGDESSDSDDEDDDEDEEEDLDADATCASGDLHDLTAAKAKQGAVEFEAVEEGCCDLLVDGGTEHSVTHLRRKGKELHVRDDGGEWHVYNVSRFPKGWSKLLPLDELVEVTD